MKRNTKLTVLTGIALAVLFVVRRRRTAGNDGPTTDPDETDTASETDIAPETGVSAVQ